MPEGPPDGTTAAADFFPRLPPVPDLSDSRRGLRLAASVPQLLAPLPAGWTHQQTTFLTRWPLG